MEQRIMDKLNWIADEFKNRKVWPMDIGKLEEMIQELTNVCWIQQQLIQKLKERIDGGTE